MTSEVPLWLSHKMSLLSFVSDWLHLTAAIGTDAILIRFRTAKPPSPWTGYLHASVVIHFVFVSGMSHGYFFPLFLLMASDGPNLFILFVLFCFVFFKKKSSRRSSLECGWNIFITQRTRLLISQTRLPIVSGTVSDVALSPKVEILC